VCASTNLHFSAEASLKETYDSNVFLQDADPAAANYAAAKAAGLRPVQDNVASWVTSVLPKIGLEYRPFTAFGFNAAYSPDVSFYHSASSEDYVAHRGVLNLGGKMNQTAWELLNTASYIDGSREGPTFARPGDVIALGGIPVRDRREAFVFKNTFRLTQTLGDWFIRPVAGAYAHDFKTHQRATPAAVRSQYVYENYIDRQEVYGGLDAGYRVLEKAHVVLGYRYGQQEQFNGPFGPGGTLIDSPYDNVYHRVLVGMEGTLTEWLKVSFLIGPDIRQFSGDLERLAPAFDQDELLYYVDASATATLTSADTLTLRATRYEQPAFSSFSMYEDTKSDLVWKHRFNEKLATSLGFTVYIGDWQEPVHRNDWIYTPNGSVSYSFTRKFAGELAYSYDWVDSSVDDENEPFTRGREFSRHLATLALRYTF
jgi:hypothetical protein